jgi:hypothetical protein
MIVFDIDGVVADARHRLHLIHQNARDYDLFYKRVVDDLVLEPGRKLYKEWEPTHEILWLSGRPERTRQDTGRWLQANGMGSSLVVPFKNHLILRADDDFRPPAALKLERIRWAEEAGCKIELVVDDNPRVCDTLDRAGYAVLQPWWGRGREMRPEYEDSGI